MPPRRALALLALASLGALGCASELGAPDASSPSDAHASLDASITLDARPAADAPASDAPARPADAGQDAARLGPPYPIVFAHGFFGFEDFAGLGFVDYYWHVRADLAAHGEPQVYTPAVDPFNDSETRGRELLAHVERVLEETGAARVNLVAHSQGGLDARVVANLRPDLVASVTTIATPHEGTPIADVVLRVVADRRLQDLLDALVRLVAAPLYDAAGDETSVFAPLRLFSRGGSDAFNAAHPDEPSVRYYSIAGRSGRSLAAEFCRRGDRASFLRRYDSTTDPTDALLSVPQAILDEPSDGLVPVSSARHGRFLGCIPADHLDEIGHLFGDSPGLLNDFDHLAFYRDLVAFLRDEGL